jgi:hypothetical protein
MRVIVYRGWPLAVALRDRVVTHPAIEALAERDESDPLVRLTCSHSTPSSCKPA